MAQKLFEGAALRITFLKGVDAEGKEVVTTKSFQGVSEQASAAQLQQFADAFASLSTYAVQQVTTATQHVIQR